MTDIKAFLMDITAAHGISGYEMEVADMIIPVFKEYACDVRTDALGNVIAKLTGCEEQEGTRPKVMLAGHMDEIPMLVKQIDERGFIRFHAQGFDQRTLPSQEVVVHGKEKLIGIIGAKPPHLVPLAERTKAIKIEDMTIDLGLSVDKVRELVQVGDPITINRRSMELKGNRIAGKAQDDRMGVAVILECFKQLKKLRFNAEVYGVATVQEEVGLRGATTATYGIVPDIGIAIDVCHGEMPGVSEFDSIAMGKGPEVSFGANIHPKVFERLVQVAKENNIAIHTDPTPAATGTDAWAMQVSRAGVATAVVSVQQRYMHTSVETLCYDDVVSAGRLLAYFIASLDTAFVEGLTCY